MEKQGRLQKPIRYPQNTYYFCVGEGQLRANIEYGEVQQNFCCTRPEVWEVHILFIFYTDDKENIKP